MEAQALCPGEASLSARVIRKDGSVQRVEGDPIGVRLPADLVAEYRTLTKRCREIEAIFMQHLSEQGE